MVSFDTSTSDVIASNSNDTKSLTVASGAILLVFIGTGVDKTPAHVPTFNGVDFTYVGDYNHANRGKRILFYKLTTPTSGTHNLVVYSPSDYGVEYTAISLTGANGNLSGQSNQETSGTTFNQNISKSADGMIVGHIFGDGTDIVDTVSPGTLREEIVTSRTAMATHDGGSTITWYFNSSQGNGIALGINVVAAPVPIPHDVTKTLKYCITKEHAAITKSLQYTVRTTPSAKTKSLKYCVITTPAKIEKGLEYRILTTPSAKTKGLIYKARPSIKIQKDLKYTVKQTPSAKTKTLKYTTITTPAKLEKGLIYKVIPSIKIEKGLIYKAVPAIAIQKTLKYAVITTPSALIKSLEYVVNPAPPQEISSGKVVVASDPTTATTPEDINGLSFNITLKNEGYIMAFMSLTSNIGLSDKKLGYFLININGVDSPVIERYHYKENDGNIEVVFRSGLLPAGQYVVKGRHYTEAGVTLTSKNITLVAFPTEDEGGNRINSIYDAVASDSVVGSTLEDIDGLTQDITTEVLSFIFRMITGSVSMSVKDKLYRLILNINGRKVEVDRFLDSVDDIGAVGLVGRSQLPETAGVINIKGRHAAEAGVTGTIAPAILVGLALSTKSGGTGYVIPSGSKYIEGAELSTVSTVLEDMPTVETEVILTQEAHIFAVMTFQSESVKADMENYFAININGVDFEECGRTSNVKLDKAVITVVARTTSKLAAGTYTIKGRWRTTSGNTLRAINDLSLVAIGLETTTQDLPTHLLRSLDYKIVAPNSVTKDLKYAILTTPTKKTKGLVYKIKKAIAITKGLIYTVISAKSVTKTLKYCVPTTPSAKTKELRYEILLGATIQKGLTYKTLVEYYIPLSLKYTTRILTKIEKTLKYVVETTPTAITKALSYYIYLGATNIPKTLQYLVRKAIKIEKDLVYKTLPSIAINKTLKYCVPSTPTAKQKELKYTIVITPTKKTKSLRYDIFLGATAIQKSLHYEILTTTKLTKDLEYQVLTIPSAITKELKYVVISPITIQKSLKYTTIITPGKITKELTYDILTIPAGITKSLRYAITVAVKIEKQLRYVALPTISIEKLLNYDILTEIAITKSLKYCIINQPSAIITKGLIYYIGGNPYDPFDSSPYEPDINPYVPFS